MSLAKLLSPYANTICEETMKYNQAVDDRKGSRKLFQEGSRIALTYYLRLHLETNAGPAIFKSACITNHGDAFINARTSRSWMRSLLECFSFAYSHAKKQDDVEGIWKRKLDEQISAIGFCAGFCSPCDLMSITCHTYVTLVTYISNMFRLPWNFW